jgi:ribonuclease P protein component
MVAGGSERFRRADRLRSSKDFRRISREGTRMASRSFVLLVADQRPSAPDAAPRLGLTVSRRVGGAVVRTRIKRRLREWFRRHRELIPPGKDLVIIARAPAGLASAEELENELASTLERLGTAR